MLLPLPWRKDFPRSGGKMSPQVTKGGVWICEAKTERAHAGKYPFRLAAARQDTFPKGTAFRGGDKLCGIAKRRPLEERLPPLRGKMSPKVTKRGIWRVSA